MSEATVCKLREFYGKQKIPTFRSRGEDVPLGDNPLVLTLGDINFLLLQRANNTNVAVYKLSNKMSGASEYRSNFHLSDIVAGAPLVLLSRMGWESTSQGAQELSGKILDCVLVNLEMLGYPKDMKIVVSDYVGRSSPCIYRYVTHYSALPWVTLGENSNPNSGNQIFTCTLDISGEE
jgi:hypothetical protein